MIRQFLNKVRLLSFSERKREFRTLARLALHGNIAAHQPGDQLRDGQAQACPFFVFSAGEVGLVEAVPDEALFIFGDADPVVADGNKDGLALFRGLDHDIGIRAAEFQGVVDEVVEDLLDLVQIRVDVEDPAGQDQPDADIAGAAGLFKGGGDIADDGIDVKVGALQEDRPGIEVVQGQKPLGQLREAVGLAQDDLQVVLVPLGRDGAVQHGLEEAPHGGQGGAEIVGDVGNEFFLVILRAGNGLCHVSEGGGEVAQFILPLHGDAVVHVAQGILLGGGDDLPEGPVHILGKEQEDDQREHQQDHQRHVGNIEHAVRVLLDGGQREMDDHVPADLELAGDGRGDAQDILVERVEEVPRSEIVPRRDGGVEPLHDSLLRGIRGLPGIHDQAPGGVEDPDLRVHVGGQRFHLGLHRIQRDRRIVQVRGIGVRDPGGLAVHPARVVADAVLRGQAGDDRGDGGKAEQGKEQVGENESKIECFPHQRNSSNDAAAARTCGSPGRFREYENGEGIRRPEGYKGMQFEEICIIAIPRICIRCPRWS